MGSLEHNFEGSGLVQVHCSKILLVQVRFGFTKMKRFFRVYGSGSGLVRHPGLIKADFAIKFCFDSFFRFWGDSLGSKIGDKGLNKVLKQKYFWVK